MSKFFSNLLVRHGDSGVGAQAAVFVQPRPVSRFESSSGRGNADFEPGEIVPVQSVSASESTGKSNGRKEKVSDTANNENAANLNKPIFDQPSAEHANSIAVERERSSHEAILQHHVKQTEPAAEVYVESRAERRIPNEPEAAFAKEHLVKQPNADPDEVGARIQSVIDHLNTLELRSLSAGQKDRSVPHHIRSEPDDQRTNQTRFVGPSVEPSIVEEEPGLLVPQHAPNLPEQREPARRGVLDAPNWLDDIRREMTERWQTIEASVQSAEPVVNVTIGRVEVRAVQAEPTKKSKAKKKPSGVMSLDDYLKERA